MLTQPEPRATLDAFYKKVRPAGPGWGVIARESGIEPVRGHQPINALPAGQAPALGQGPEIRRRGERALLVRLDERLLPEEQQLAIMLPLLSALVRMPPNPRMKCEVSAICWKPLKT